MSPNGASAVYRGTNARHQLQLRVYQGQLQPQVRPEAFAPKSSRRIEGRADQCRQKPERRMEMYAHQQTEGKQGAYSGDKL